MCQHLRLKDWTSAAVMLWKIVSRDGVQKPNDIGVLKLQPLPDIT
jgi:hypothetical protein